MTARPVAQLGASESRLTSRRGVSRRAPRVAEVTVDLPCPPRRWATPPVTWPCSSVSPGAAGASSSQDTEPAGTMIVLGWLVFICGQTLGSLLQSSPLEDDLFDVADVEDALISLNKKEKELSSENSLRSVQCEDTARKESNGLNFSSEAPGPSSKRTRTSHDANGSDTPSKQSPQSAGPSSSTRTEISHGATGSDTPSKSAVGEALAVYHSYLRLEPGVQHGKNDTVPKTGNVDKSSQGARAGCAESVQTKRDDRQNTAISEKQKLAAHEAKKSNQQKDTKMNTAGNAMETKRENVKGTGKTGKIMLESPQEANTLTEPRAQAAVAAGPSFSPGTSISDTLTQGFFDRNILRASLQWRSSFSPAAKARQTLSSVRNSLPGQTMLSRLDSVKTSFKNFLNTGVPSGFETTGQTHEAPHSSQRADHGLQPTGTVRSASNSTRMAGRASASPATEIPLVDIRPG
ncbi:uncharacterized protein [Lepisosteus oculatus]|uniref:uncharacterized protein isoform X3 n=1 Tax=Lepisosteus oculatus TaxID=7918 RepID=UPI00073FBE88|nr:PREDICTED: uncharacterized protein LOC107075782 isoform X3 [Lepisosteus oculatus]